MKKIYHHAQIITMNEKQPHAQALRVEDGLITHVGSNEEILALKDDESQLIDVHEQIMIPSFIDSHSHFIGLANSLRLCDLSQATSFDEIITMIKQFIQLKQLNEGEWVVATGYDHNHLKEQCHPDKFILDQISITHPILISHSSSHMGVANSKALEVLKLDFNTQDPHGGRFARVNNSNEMTGYMEENAFIRVNQQLPMLSHEAMLELIDKAQTIYASYGITSVQEGMVVPELFDLLDYAACNKRLKLDVTGYVDLANSHDLMRKHQQYAGDYVNHFRLGGYKIFLDGSPQGKTAWMKTPYVGDCDNYGYPTLSDQTLTTFIETAIQEQQQLLAHCNGDAATDQYLTQFERVMHRFPTLSTCRPVIIHAQLLAKDQLPRVKALDMIPSFFVAHTYYWGDIHIANFTKERASQISPTKSCEKLQIAFTLHQDSPVIMPNMLETMGCAVLRVTKNGVILGEEECITPMEALRAVTLHAAHQYFEEATKGSIEVGKLADLVILDDNPLTVPKKQIKQDRKSVV